MILFDEVKDGDIVCHKSVRLDGHYRIPSKKDGDVIFKKPFSLVETQDGYDVYVEDKTAVNKLEAKNIKEAIDIVKEHYGAL